MASTSYTQPPQVPPLCACRAAHRRVSSGRSGVRSQVGAGLAGGQPPRALGRIERLVSVTHEVDGPAQIDAVDFERNDVAVY